jgi:1,4-dihydroxy-2-naphthoate polyprenyltransferase
MLAIRPKTLTASIAPVIVGTGYALSGALFSVGGEVRTSDLSTFPWSRVLAAFAVGVGIQIGTNLVNDVADHFKGADTHERLGPPRVTNLGLLTPRAVVAGAVAAFGVASLAGLWLASVSSWVVLVPGALALACGVLYTVGPVSIAYLGLGEIFVLGFFGIFATAGTTFVLTEGWSVPALIAGVSMGLFATGILEANNIRDIPTDAPVGKRTLAVRMGDPAARKLYAIVIVGALAFAVVAGPLPGSLLVLLAAPLAWRAVAPVLRGAAGRDLIAVLQMNSLLEITVGIVLAIVAAVTPVTIVEVIK